MLKQNDTMELVFIIRLSRDYYNVLFVRIPGCVQTLGA